MPIGARGRWAFLDARLGGGGFIWPGGHAAGRPGVVEGGWEGWGGGGVGELGSSLGLDGASSASARLCLAPEGRQRGPCALQTHGACCCASASALNAAAAAAAAPTSPEEKIQIIIIQEIKQTTKADQQEEITIK